jgi:hypothetical protein
MKHIKEYSDDELSDLLGDLESVGQGPLRGWMIYLTSRTGLSTIEILIANDWDEALNIYDKNGQFSGQKHHLASALSKMKLSGSIVYWDILDGFKAKAYKKGYKKWQNNNPYTTVEILEHFFTNSKDILKNQAINSQIFPTGIDTIKEV